MESQAEQLNILQLQAIPKPSNAKETNAPSNVPTAETGYVTFVPIPATVPVLPEARGQTSQPPPPDMTLRRDPPRNVSSPRVPKAELVPPNTMPFREPLPTPNAAPLGNPLPTPNAAPLGNPLLTPNAAPLGNPLLTPNAAHLCDPAIPGVAPLAESKGSLTPPASWHALRKSVYEISNVRYTSQGSHGKYHNDNITALDLPTLGPFRGSEETLRRSKVKDMGGPMAKLPPRSVTVGKTAGSKIMGLLYKTEAPPLPPRSQSVQYEDIPSQIKTCGGGSGGGGGDRDGGGGDGGDRDGSGGVDSSLKRLPPVSFAAASPVAALSDIVRWYGSVFPIDLHVHSGLSTSKRTPEHEFLRVNNLSHAPVLRAESFDGWGFDIPFNTDLRLALLYDPDNDRQAAVQGYQFVGIACTLSLVPRPKLLSVVGAWSSTSVCLTDGEVIAPGDGSSPKRGGFVRVYSLTDKVTKELPWDCPASFSTRALPLCLSVPDIVAYVPCPFPSKACVLKHDMGPKCYPSNVVLLKGLGIAPVLRCTPMSQVVASGDNGGNNLRVPTVFHLPIKLPGLKVVVIDTQVSGGPGSRVAWGPEVDWGSASVHEEDCEPAERTGDCEPAERTGDCEPAERTGDCEPAERTGDYVVKGKTAPEGDYVPLLISATSQPSSDYCTLRFFGVSHHVPGAAEGNSVEEEEEEEEGVATDMEQQPLTSMQSPEKAHKAPDHSDLLLKSPDHSDLLPNDGRQPCCYVATPILNTLSLNPSSHLLATPPISDMPPSSQLPTTPPRPSRYVSLQTTPSLSDYSLLNIYTREGMKGPPEVGTSRTCTGDPPGGRISGPSTGDPPGGRTSGTASGSPGDNITDPSTGVPPRGNSGASIEGSPRDTEGLLYDHIQPNQSQKTPIPVQSSISEDEQDRNLKVLKKLTLADVQSLLDALGMGVYKPVFEREHIGGCVLSLLSQDILEELHVTTEHSRILTDIITGIRPLPPM